MAEERYKSVSTFALPDEYQRQASEARRRRRMAEMLAQQAYQPGDIQNAPIPRAAPLVQGLQAYLTARAARKADEAEESAAETQTREAKDFLNTLTRPKEDFNKIMNLGEVAQIGTPELVDGQLKYPDTFMEAPNLKMVQQAGPRVQLGRKPEDDQVYMPTDVSRFTATGRETDPQRMAAMLANPQFQSGFTDEQLLKQRLNLTREAMLTSENPMVQKVASAIYPTLQPEKAKLQLGNINPADFTPASIAAAMKSGNVGDLVSITKPVDRIGKPSPGDFTIASLARFNKTGDYKDLVGIPKPAGGGRGQPPSGYKWTSEGNLEKISGGPADKPDGLSETAKYRLEDSMRTQFERLITPLETELSQIAKITNIVANSGGNLKNIDAISQQSLVILLNKFLDPTSVVREGEFNRVVEAQGLIGQSKNAVDRILSGKPLDANTIQQIVNLANLYERAATGKIKQYAIGYGDTARKRGLDIGSIINNPNYIVEEIPDDDVEAN